MKKIIRFSFCFVIFALSINGLESHKWEGQTDKNGRATVLFRISPDSIFYLQGYIFFQENWRPIPIFWNKNSVWFDLGPSFESVRYKIFFLLEKPNDAS